MKKTPGDITILHQYAKNHDHMLYCSWDKACDGCNCYFSFWSILCPCTPITAQKWKKTLEISSFYTIVPKIIIICYTALDIWCMTDVIIFHFGLFFALLPPLQPITWKFQQQQKKRRKKIPRDIFILHKCTKNHNAILFLRYCMWI